MSAKAGTSLAPFKKTSPSDGRTELEDLQAECMMLRDKLEAVQNAYDKSISERHQLERSLADQIDRYQGLIDHSPIATCEADLSEAKKHLDLLRSRGVTNLEKYLNDNPDDILISDYANLWKIISINELGLGNNPGDPDGMLKKYSDSIKNVLEYHDNHVKYLNDFFEGRFDFVNELVGPKDYPKCFLIKVSVPNGFQDSLARVFITHYDITTERALQKEILLRRQEEARSRELYKAEEELRRQLEQQMQERIEFTRSLVHEIKTPLTSVLAASELLTSQSGNEVQTSLARTLFQSAIELNSRVDEMFDLTRGEMGTLTLRRARVNLVELFHEITESVRPQAILKNQRLVENIAPSFPDVFIDSGRIRQVAVNLLNNALKFTPENGTIEFKAYPREKDFIVEVSDTGPGIGKQEQEHLFQAYHRSHRGKERFSGLGLGLAISKMLVDLHSGSIWVKSEEKKGSTFTFSIPLTQPD